MNVCMYVCNINAVQMNINRLREGEGIFIKIRKLLDDSKTYIDEHPDDGPHPSQFVIEMNNNEHINEIIYTIFIFLQV